MGFPIVSGSTRERDTNAAPLVSIFGAGIAGLSLAHELIERGMAVQVFEAKSDPDEEYSCQVGGLAANQLVRVPARAMRLHPYFYWEQAGAEEPIPPIARSVVVWIVSDPLTRDLNISIDGKEMSQAIKAGEPAADAAQALVDFVNNDADLSSYVVADHVAGSKTVQFSAMNEYDLLDVSLFHPGTPPVPTPDARWEQARHLALLSKWGGMQRAQPRFPLPHRLQFERPAYVGNAWLGFLDNFGIANRDKLAMIWTTLKQAYTTYSRLRAERIAEIQSANADFYLSERMLLREELCVELRGHADGSGTSEESRALSQTWVESVRDELIAQNTAEGDPIPSLDQRLMLLALGDLDPIGNPRTRAGRRRNDRVEVRIVEDILPAEHGYRYFPCFYRHLFDTMRRTPILDEKGRETGETAYDRLVATPATDVALSRDRVPAAGCRDEVTPEDEVEKKREKRDPEAIPTRHPLSLEDFRTLLRIHLERMNICERDILQFQYRLLMFLTASDARRRTWEKLSWFEFLGAHEPGRYSARMVQLLMDTPQALLAMNAAETEAHTQGLIYCQLLLDALTGADAMTLNGPTSKSWLDEWKRYLRRQGVRFFNARLDSLDWTPSGELIPKVTLMKGAGPSVTAYLVDSDGVDVTIDGRRYLIPMPGLNPGQQARRFIEILRGRLWSTEFGVLEIHLPDPAPESAELKITAQPRTALLTIRRAGPARVTVNGAELTADGDFPRQVRDDLLAQLHAAGFDASAEGEASVRIGANEPDQDPEHVPWRAMVSVRRSERGVYGVRLGDLPPVVINTAAPTATQIRNLLLVRLLDLDPGFVPLGQTGIRIPETWRPWQVDVSEWDGMSLGPIIDERERWVDVTVRDKVEVAVHAAMPDISMQSASAPPILPDPTGTRGSDFYVLAVPYEEASRLVWEAWDSGGQIPFDGVFAELMEFDQKTGRRDDVGDALALQCDASGRPVPPHWPLRDLSGIQFYFDHQVRIGHGHTYFVDSPWGLSSISQIAYWRQRMSQASPFLGQVSVDVGNWYRAVDRVVEQVDAGGVVTYVHEFHPEAWHSTRCEIANEVWRQVLAGEKEQINRFIVEPAWYHIDEGIRFAPFEATDGRRAFSRPAVVLESVGAAADLSLRVDGIQIDVAHGSSDDLADAIEAATDHLAHAFAEVNGRARIAIAPVAVGVHSVRILVGFPDLAPAQIEFRVSVNLVGHPGTVASYTCQANDQVDTVRQGIVAAVMSTLPGVIAEVEPPQYGEGRSWGIRLRSTQPMRVSVSAFDGETPVLWTNPSGGLEIEPLVDVEIEDGEARATPIANATPFLINTPDRKDAAGNPIRVWDSRPGVLPVPDPEKGPFLYKVALKRWLMVGNHMATHTRLSTMESANESARHAAISILHTLMEQPNGILHGRTPEIWPPSENELPDARPFKRLDERLVEAELPHFLEILKIGDWLDGLPHDLPPVPDGAKLKELIEFARKQVQTDWRFTQLDELEKLLPAALQALIGP